MDDASSSRRTLDEVRDARVQETQRAISALVAAHADDVRAVFCLLVAGERTPSSAGQPHAEAPADAAVAAFVREHAIDAPRPVTPLDARVAALTAVLRHAARRAVLHDSAAVELRRRPVLGPQLPVPIECEFELPALPVPDVLTTLGPSPLSVTYASALRPLPPDPQRRITGLGLGGGALHHRPRKGAQRAPKGRTAVELWRWGIRARACPCAALVRKASKCLLTRDWKVAFAEQRFVKAIARVDELKRDGAWSFRQPKRVRGPAERKTHWDYLLDEMRWLQTDYREERKWKIAVAHELAHQAALWHRASPELRAAMCVPRSAGSEHDVSAEYVEAGEGGEEDAVDGERDGSGEAEARDEPPTMDVDEPPAPAPAPTPTDPSPEPDLAPPDTDADGGDEQMRAGAPDRDATLSTRLPPALVTAVRAPIFSMDATATSVSPWALLHSLDPETAAALLQIDGGSDGELLKSLDPAQLDFASLFPELPQYAPPAPPSADESRAGDRRRDEGATQTRLAHVTRLMDTRPVLVSTLRPSLHRVRGQWRAGVDTPDVPDAPEAPAHVPGSLLFARRAGKASREPAAHASAVPPAPADPAARAAQLAWTAGDDEFLRQLARAYHNNWPLIADVFNSARHMLAGEERTPWDCLERMRRLSDDAPVDVQPDGARRRARRQHLADAVKKCAKLREHVHKQAAAAMQASAAAAAAARAGGERQKIATPTPQALSMLKAERDHAALRQFLEQQRAAQLAFQ